VPCYDARAGRETQACHIGGDRPVEAPQPYAACCDGAGSARGICLPGDILSEPERTRLPVDSCKVQDARCVPSQVTDPTQCQAGSGLASETGLCVAQCFLSASDLLFLVRSGCASDQRCVPCSSSSLPPGLRCG
jgi:hypothetical protein